MTPDPQASDSLTKGIICAEISKGNGKNEKPDDGRWKEKGVDLETRKGGTTRRRKTSEYSGALKGGEGRAPVSGVGKG